MHSVLGLTGVPPLTCSGKPLEISNDFEMQSDFPPPPPYTQNQLPFPLYALPLTPDASPSEWERSKPRRAATPLDHASSLYPPGAPLYGLGFHPSCFEDEEELQTITISAPQPMRHDDIDGIPTPHMTPLLSHPPLGKARLQQRSTIPLPTSPFLGELFSQGEKTARYSLRRRRRNRQLYQRVVWATCLGLILFLVHQKIVRSAGFNTWLKRNHQWSASVHSTEDSIYGLEEDYTPKYYHRTQRRQYLQHLSREPPSVPQEDNTDIPMSVIKDEVEHHVFNEGALLEDQDLFFADSASDTKEAAISQQINNILSFPEVTSYISSIGADALEVYREALSVMASHDSDIILDPRRDNVLSILQKVDERRRSFLKAMVHFLRLGGRLPQEWTAEASLDSVIRHVWTIAPNNLDFLDMISASPSGPPEWVQSIFSGEWESKISTKEDVTVFVKSTSTHSQRLRKILSPYRMLVQPTYIDLDERADGEIIATLLRRLTGIQTLPNVLVRFESIGGWHQILVLQSEGALKGKFATRR